MSGKVEPPNRYDASDGEIFTLQAGAAHVEPVRDVVHSREPDVIRRILGEASERTNDSFVARAA
jgi:hypothetical protein